MQAAATGSLKSAVVTLLGGLSSYCCRAGQAELSQQELGRVHLVLLDGRPRRGGEVNLQVNRDAAICVTMLPASPLLMTAGLCSRRCIGRNMVLTQLCAGPSCVLILMQGRTCSMKRAIIPEQPVPASLAALQQHLQATSPQQASAAAGSYGSSPVYSGPVSSLQTGDYVAVYVQQLSGTSTLLSQPLARTSIQEFARVFGSTTPSEQQMPAWLPSMLAVTSAVGSDSDEGLTATAGLRTSMS